MFFTSLAALACLLPSVAVAQISSWTQLSPAQSPPATAHHSVVYDSVRQRVVLIGWDSATQSRMTWEWDGTTWQHMRPATSPSMRTAFAACFDAGRGKTILFGGNDDTGPCAETWEWDGRSWTQVITATTPPARRETTMAYDSSRGRVVMFGGYSPFSIFEDTWEYDGTDWHSRNPVNSPPGLVNHGTVYDSRRNVTVVFGGMSNWRNVNSTWEWDGTNWTRRSPADSPPPREPHDAMAFDPTRGVTVLFGGGVRGGAHLGDTWEWDGVNWIQVTAPGGPSSRHLSAMCFDIRHDETILFGGSSGSGGTKFSDTWRYAPPSASYSTYRQSCLSSVGLPALTATNPIVGQPWTLTVDNLAPNTAGHLFFALNDQRLGVARLPVDLSPVGAPGCYINVNTLPRSGAVMNPVSSDARGQVLVQIGLPNDPSLIGAEFFNQYASVDSPNSRSLNITTTNAGRGIIGL